MGRSLSISNNHLTSQHVRLNSARTWGCAVQVTDEAMLAFLLRRVRESAVFLVSSERLQRRLLRAALGVFGEGSASPRLQALLLLRALALHLPQPMPSNVLKVCHMLLACISSLSSSEQMRIALVPVSSFAKPKVCSPGLILLTETRCATMQNCP